MSLYKQFTYFIIQNAKYIDKYTKIIKISKQYIWWDDDGEHLNRFNHTSFGDLCSTLRGYGSSGTGIFVDVFVCLCERKRERQILFYILFL